jgi:hypothetical protein
MKLSDVMSSATDLSAYAEVALVIFLSVFLGVALDLIRSGRRHQAMSLLPLSEAAPARKSHGKSGGQS